MASVLRSYDGEREGNLRPIEEYLPFVKRVAQRLARRLPSHIALEDLISAGVVGLLEAMSRYDSSRVTDFEKFAEFRVKGAILDDLRRRDLMARDARLESKNIENAVQDLTKELSREPEEEELAEKLDLSVPDLRKKLEKLTPVRVVSFTDVYPMIPMTMTAHLTSTKSKSLSSCLPSGNWVKGISRFYSFIIRRI